ncbi:hypothetical protein ASU31_08170 [Pedobacter ginsenosidimutans]|uniref:Uncharacterized protein n=1 Tax=Pedobacter ginsenosidimutans TaxID=687842 RepID=A0A0T5VSE5_9SPHI|nr:hypothetical protein [Pedobacter ginsenosidimutans]KRT16778.1 hypothetical protein ASU31_08170 [Pedobacter ginsenosidimutans]
MWEKLKNIIGIIILVSIGLVLLLIFSPLIIISMISDHIEEKKNEKLYLEYLLKIDGHKFFCYNNRRDCQEFIEKYIIPTLPSEVKLIFLDGRYPKSDYSQRFASTLLYKIENQVGFPYLLKVQHGIVMEKSVNNELYNSLNQGHDIQVLYNVINKFYQEEYDAQIP